MFDAFISLSPDFIQVHRDHLQLIEENFEFVPVSQSLLQLKSITASTVYMQIADEFAAQHKANGLMKPAITNKKLIAKAQSLVTPEFINEIQKRLDDLLVVIVNLNTMFILHKNMMVASNLRVLSSYLTLRLSSRAKRGISF